MNPILKPAAFFVLGGALATGVVLYSVKRDATPQQTTVATAPAPVQPVPSPTPSEPPALEPAKPVEDTRPAVTPSAPSARRREIVPPRRAESTVARNRAPESAPTAAAKPPAASTSTTPPVTAPAPEEKPAEQSNRLPSIALPPPPRDEPPPPKPNTVTIPGGTLLNVRLGETLSSERLQPGDTFSATLDQPLIVDGFVLAERGARAQGRVVEVDRGGRVHGVATMSLELTNLTTSDGQRVRLTTDSFQRRAESSKKSDAAKIGAGAAIGAAIGAIAGGGKGAAIGAGIGGAAGTGGVLATRGGAANMPAETRVAFRLREPVTVTERLRR